VATNPPIVIGELADVPAPGSGVKSAWCQEVTNRIHHRFATPAARATAFPAPAIGQASYLTAADATQGPEYFDGIAWRKPWNLPWGLVAPPAVMNVDATNFGATLLDIPGATITFPVIAGRWYEASWVISTTNTAGGIQTFYISMDGAQSIASYQSAATGQVLLHSGSWYFFGGSVPAGSRVIKMRAQVAAGAMNMPFGSGMNGRFAIRDIGPVTATTPSARPGDEDRDEVEPL
jgi:hypothetical protein